MKKKEIAGYVRVSTVKQKIDGVSIEMQQEMIVKHAMMMELVEKEDQIKFYIDDGYSGKSLERPKIKELISKIKKEEVEVLLCYDLARLSRDLFDCNSFLKLLKKYNVAIKCLYDKADISTAGDRFTTNIKILNNQYERERIVERTNDGLMAIVESGRYPFGGKLSLGYARDEKKNVYIHSTDSLIVRTIFDMACKGYSLREIESKVNKMENSYNEYLSLDRIRHMIMRKLYTGTFTFKGKEYKGIIPQIVDNKTFNLAQRAVKRNTNTRRNYLFDNKVVCQGCGSVLSNTHGASRGKRYFYYRCEKCKKNISEKAIETSLRKNEPAERSYKTKKRTLSKIEKKIEMVNTRIERTKQKFVDNIISDKDYLFMVIPLDDELKKLRKEQSFLKNEINYPRRFCDIVNEEEKRKYVHIYVDKIIVDINSKKVINIIMKK